MANLVFPQLSSGAMAQYPIRKSHTVRTVKNVMTGGDMLLYSDPNGAMMTWQLEYVELPALDIAAIQTHFTNCAGPFHAFTFIDPTDNMLAASGDFNNSAWNIGPSVQITSGQPDPAKGFAAFTVVNNGQIGAGLSQTLLVPASYQYCLSVYLQSAQGAAVTLMLNGSFATETQTFPVGGTWMRAVLSGRMADPGQSLTAVISVASGNQIQLYGPQLEAQLAPSSYRQTSAQGGIYSNAHWVNDHLPVIATAPGLFSTVLSIEAAL